MPKTKTFHVFDCLFSEGKNITGLDLVERHKHAEEYIQKQSFPSLKLQMKKFYYQSISKDIKNLCHGAWKIYNERPKNAPPIDGLVYNPLEGGYYAQPILKWKPLHHKTVDFLLIKQSPSKVGLYVLTNRKNNNKTSFNWMNNKSNTYAKLVRTESIPASKYTNESVYEMGYDPVADKWSIKMLRNNKNQTYKNFRKNGILKGPNYVTTYNSIVRYFKDPIKEDEIMCEKDDQYYQNINYSKTKTQGLRNFHQWLKTQLYKKYIQKGDKILEIAGGRGGDIKKTLNRNVNYLLLSNINKEGLTKAKGKANKFSRSAKVNILEANASKNITKEIKAITSTKFDVVSIQMAFHYFLKNKTSLKNIFKNIDTSLKKGGYFMATFIDGNKVSKEKDNKMEFKSNGKTIFSITKLFKKQKDLGSEIKVFGETFGEQNEFLVNVDFIRDFFEQQGYTLIEQESFKSIYKKYKNLSNKNKNRNRNFIEMTNGEKGYSFLFTTFVLRKN
jgi:SAM-dependent methyltransferase